MFSQGYRPGTLGDRGFSPEALAQAAARHRRASRCAPSATSGRGRRAAASTRWCRRSAASPRRQGELFPGAEPGPQFYPVSAIDYLTGYLMAFGAMVALARRAREGGSWLVRISLAQIGRWLVDRGQVPEAELEGRAEGVHAGGARALVDRRARRRSGGCTISRRCCGCPRRRRAGRGRRCRSATTSRCGRRGPGKGSRRPPMLVEYACDDHVATLTLNRPEKLNASATSWSMALQRRALRVRRRSRGLRRHHAAAAGRAFCSAGPTCASASCAAARSSRRLGGPQGFGAHSGDLLTKRSTGSR